MGDRPPNEASEAAPLCLVCHTSPISYATVPCHHPTLCKKCAMKQASGGRCKVCKQMFGELRRWSVEEGIEGGNVQDDDEDEEEFDGDEEEDEKK
ncbi:hypothetical protein HDU97_001913 [Phlyctochytrium planicorne]|nr:hypothetical protein HDU97_001913 [Phlyctochytrium planicorne]